MVAVLDLNLLRVFDVMLEERSVTRAGARLGLTQSAVSHALNRLRYALGDELFVRGPHGMHPTARAAEIGPQVHAALLQLQTAVAPADFHPASSERRFVLAAGSYSCAVLTPPLASRMAAEAPMAELAMEPYTPDVFEQLDAHRLDFIVGGVISAPARFAHEAIVRESLAWVVRADHPLAKLNRVELADLVSVPHAVIAYGRQGLEEATERRGVVTRGSWEDAGAFELALAAEGLTRRIGVSVPDSYSALAVVGRSDMVTLIPRRLALTFAQHGRFKLIEPPHEYPSVELSLIYLKERLLEPAIAWMRDLIRTTAAAI
jgi:DNA-binding transcriptional LysR family regulator